MMAAALQDGCADAQSGEIEGAALVYTLRAKEHTGKARSRLRTQPATRCAKRRAEVVTPYGALLSVAAVLYHAF